MSNANFKQRAITEENPYVGSTKYTLSFCSGYAGIERGLELAGVQHRVLTYVEIEAFAIANLVAKMEQGELATAPVYTDLKTFPAGIFRGAVDLITAGYPCQPFSAAGKRQGAEDPRHLWPYVSEAIGIIRPRRVFVENVEGHISLGLREVLSDLEGRGYRTAWGVFSATEVGAPHQRKRVYIMGDSDELQCPDGVDRRWSKRGPASAPPGAQPPAGGGRLDGADRGAVLADTQRQGLERLPGDGPGGAEQGRQPPQQDGPACPCSLCGGEHDYWCPEPGLGRVVNGGSNRVDRIRLLGNGVVPQTAARAWQTLENELEDCS